jgi:hypothetical protein
MPSTKRDELTELLGDVDELIIERILETGATVDEVGEALSYVEDEQGLGEGQRAPSSSRVVEVRAILADLFQPEDDEESVPIGP